MKFKTSVLIVCIAVALVPLPFAGRCLTQAQQVHPLSLISLLLRVEHDGRPIAVATGFVLVKNSKYYLVTNRHVIRRCVEDQRPSNVGGWICANHISVFYSRKGLPAQRIWVTESLFTTDGRERWLEHPALGGAADVIALPLVATDNVELFPLDIGWSESGLFAGVGDTVSIIGFPFGDGQSEGLPIWKSGRIASDLTVSWNGIPTFLVDSTAREGMSGSPVYAVATGAMLATGTPKFLPNSAVAVRFLGLYSAQSVQAEIGVVWKAEVIRALYDSLS